MENQNEHGHFVSLAHAAINNNNAGITVLVKILSNYILCIFGLFEITKVHVKTMNHHNNLACRSD